MEKIADFHKVSLNQFVKDYHDESLTKDQIEDILNNTKLPERSTSGSAGYDFISTKDFDLNAGETILIPTGVRCKIEDGWFLMIAPRSGHGFKYRLQLDNTVGIIDADYYNADNEGHIMIKMTNDSKSPKTLSVKRGDKIAQGIFLPYGITRDDNAKEIRTGGFGSTGK